MKKTFLLISLFLITATLAYSLAPVTVVLNNDGDNLTVRLNDYTSGSPVQVGNQAEYTIPSVTPNGSGMSSFVVGEGDIDWGNIPPASINNSVILDVYDNSVLIAQFRLDRLIEITARSERVPRVRVAKITVDSAATFEQQVEIKGPLVLSSGTFINAVELDTLTTNIMIFTGNGTSVVEADFSNLLANGTTYTIVNQSIYGSLGITLDSGGPINLAINQSATIIKVGNKLYFVAKP